MKFLTQTFLFLWIFFIPSSLAYHYNVQTGLVHGILVDYRIPIISADVLFFIAFLALSFLRRQESSQLKKLLVFSIGFTMIFQFCLALFQTIFQRSLFGYLPFGEVDYHSPAIAKGVFNGFIYKLPYGTTVHPNILAGFFVVCFLVLATYKTKFLKYFFLMTLLIIFLTQSLSALIALLAGILVFLINKKYLKLAKILVILFGLGVVFVLSNIRYTKYDIPSLARRAQLEQLAFSMIHDHPLTGVGWNNFTLEMDNYGYVRGNVRFLQPVHNMFLLLISELGIFGIVLVAIWIKLIWKANQITLVFLSAFTVLSSFDHYLLTLTTGRMLLILSLVVIKLVSSRPHSSMDKTGDF